MVYTDKDQVRVVIFTATYRVEGEIHVPVGARLTDALNSKAKDFLAVTDARVYQGGIDAPIYESSYLAVNRQSITLILPA